MPEQIFDVKVVEVEYICDKCGEGKMIHSSVVYPTLHVKYPHKCDKCGHEAVFSELYPCYRYIKAE